MRCCTRSAVGKVQGKGIRWTVTRCERTLISSGNEKVCIFSAHSSVNLKAIVHFVQPPHMMQILMGIPWNAAEVNDDGCQCLPCRRARCSSNENPK